MASLVAAKLIFLTDLTTVHPGDKVRFLGCIDSYDTDTGILTAKHNYDSSKHVAKITIEHVRDTLSSSATASGAWVNVVGYVQSHGAFETTVQATMLWEAGPVKISDYERALQARKDATEINAR